MNTKGKYKKKKKILLGACPNSPRRPDTPRFTVRTLGNTASNPKEHRSGGDAVFALTRTDNKPRPLAPIAMSLLTKLTGRCTINPAKPGLGKLRPARLIHAVHRHLQNV